MDAELVPDDDLPVARKSIVPGAGFFLPDDFEAGLEERATAAALDGAEAAVVADPDADGLACVALLREAYDDALAVPEPDAADEDDGTSSDGPAGDGTAGDGPAGDGADDGPAGDGDDDGPAGDGDEAGPAGLDALGTPVPVDPAAPGAALENVESTPHSVALVPASPHEIEDALGRVAEYADPGLDLYVCDLCPDRYEYVETDLAAAIEVADGVRWFDHHQWDAGVAAAVRDAGVDLVVGDSDAECSADVTLRSVEYAFDDRFAELAAVTRDHDLWLREDPRSDDLADYAYWTEPAEYVEVVREYGVDLPTWVDDFLAERRVEKEALIDHAVQRAEFRAVGGYTVGVTYGRCSQNEVAEAMREDGADASVIVKPAGSASIRGTDAFDRCHEVAGRVNGGGHPKAAGCKPDIYGDALDYAHHWTSRGAVAKQVILDAFRDVVGEEGDPA